MAAIEKVFEEIPASEYRLPNVPYSYLRSRKSDGCSRSSSTCRRRARTLLSSNGDRGDDDDDDGSGGGGLTVIRPSVYRSPASAVRSTTSFSSRCKRV